MADVSKITLPDGSTYNIDAVTVNGHTVNTNVPANATFTDTTDLNQMTGTLPVNKGGTGAIDAEAARSNLGLGSAATKAIDTSISKSNLTTNIPTTAAVINFVENQMPKNSDISVSLNTLVVQDGDGDGDKEEGSIQVDTTLSIQGMAADAKAAGDEIAKLKNVLSTSAELDNEGIVTFYNSNGIEIFTLDLSDIGTGGATYGNLIVSTNSLELDEGGNGVFTVKLESAPSGNQPVYIAVSDVLKLGVSPQNLTFTSANYNTPQTITVFALEDDDKLNENETISITSRKVTGKQIAVAITDTAVDLVTSGLVSNIQLRNRVAENDPENPPTIVNEITNNPCTVYNIDWNSETSGFVPNGLFLKKFSDISDTNVYNESTYSTLFTPSEDTFDFSNGCTIEYTVTGATGGGFRFQTGSTWPSFGPTATVNRVWPLWGKKSDGSVITAGYTDAGVSSYSADYIDEHTYSFVYTKSTNLVDFYIDGDFAKTLDMTAKEDFDHLGIFDVTTSVVFRLGTLAPSGTQNTIDCIISEFRIYDRSLSASEILTNYHWTLKQQQISNFKFGVNDITLEIADLFAPFYKVTPQTIKSYEFNSVSENPNIVNDTNNVLTALTNGETTITGTANFKGVTLDDEIDIHVNDLQYNLSSSRTINDITLARYTNDIEVGDEFVCQAYALSEVTAERPFKYQYADGNLIYFESSNPSVCKVKNGVLTGISEGAATITVKDIDNTVSKTFNVTVEPKTYLSYTENEVYYTESFNSNDPETTTVWIAEQIATASDGNYKKIVFANGLYYVSPEYGTINIPTNMIIDFNDSTIQIIESAMTQTGYTMFHFVNTEYSSIINAHIFGERYLIEGIGKEFCYSIAFSGNCYRSGLENCEISNSPGFNISFGNTNRKLVGCKLDSIEAGGLSAIGEPIEESYCFRTNSFFNISNIGSTIGLGNMQGFQGYSYMSARVYDMCFYDSSYNFISKLNNCIQYYMYPKPSNAVYAKIAFNWGSIPTSRDPDYYSIAHFYSQDRPKNCYIRNCLLENNYSTAIAPNGGESWIIENCIFNNNGVRDPASHIDWEDGRNNNKGHILKNCTFNGGGQITAVGADGLAIHNNIFKKCTLAIGNEVQNSRIWLNQFVNGKANISTKTDMVFSQNYGDSNSIFTLTQPTDVNFAIQNAENVDKNT